MPAALEAETGGSQFEISLGYSTKPDSKKLQTKGLGCGPSPKVFDWREKGPASMNYKL
jgi:hypothetical protein